MGRLYTLVPFWTKVTCEWPLVRLKRYKLKRTRKGHQYKKTNTWRTQESDGWQFQHFISSSHTCIKCQNLYDTTLFTSFRIWRVHYLCKFSVWTGKSTHVQMKKLSIYFSFYLQVIIIIFFWNRLWTTSSLTCTIDSCRHSALFRNKSYWNGQFELWNWNPIQCILGEHFFLVHGERETMFSTGAICARVVEP